MSDMNRRLKKVEKALNVGQEEQRVVEIVMFCDGELPDRTYGNITIHHVRHYDKARQ